MRAGASRLVRLALAALLIVPAALLWLFWAARPMTDIADRPLAPLPAEGPLTITAFGTSLTAKNDWPEALGRALTTCLGREVRIGRVALPGAGSAWGQGAVDRVIAQTPDLVLMEFAINDADMRDGVPLAVARQQHDTILTRLADALPDAQILMMTMSPAYGLRGWSRPFLAQHYAQYRDLAEAHATGLLDVHPRWLAAPQALRRFDDGLHPGDAAVREVLLAPLSEAVVEAAGGGC